MSDFPSDKNINIGLLPPQAIEFEEAVLGAILVDKNALINVANILKPEMFYKEANQNVYKAILSLSKKHTDIDLMTVVQELRELGVLEEVGGALYVSRLSGDIGSASHIEAHADIIVTKFTQREVIRIANDITKKAYSESTSDELVTDFSKGVTDISLIGNSHKSLTSEELVELSLKETEIRTKHFDEFGELKGVKSNIGSLDKVINGFRPANTYILAATTGVGKSNFALKLTKEFAKQDYNTLYFSLEMTGKELMDRLLLSETDVEADKFLEGDLTPANWSQLNKAAETIYNLPINISDDYGMSIDNIRTQIALHQSKNGCDVVVIDYLNLIKPSSDNKRYGRTEEIEEISRRLKAISKEFNIPIIVLAQLNRNVHDSGSKRPYSHHLKGSSGIEMDSTAIMLLYRPSMHEITEDDDGKQLPENYMEVIVSKNRNGRSGIIRLIHNDNVNEFFEYAENYEGSVDNFTDF